MKKLLVILGAILLLGSCSEENVISPDHEISVIRDMDLNKMDGLDTFNLTTNSYVEDGDLYVEATLELEYASGDAYGINLPVNYNAEEVSPQSYMMGDIYICEHDQGDNAQLFVNLHSSLVEHTVMTAHIMWQDASARWTCDGKRNDFMTITFKAYDIFSTNHGINWGCEETIGSGEFIKVRDSENQPLPFRVMLNGVDITNDYINDCDLIN